MPARRPVRGGTSCLVQESSWPEQNHVPFSFFRYENPPEGDSHQQLENRPQRCSENKPSENPDSANRIAVRKWTVIRMIIRKSYNFFQRLLSLKAYGLRYSRDIHLEPKMPFCDIVSQVGVSQWKPFLSIGILNLAHRYSDWVGGGADECHEDNLSVLRSSRAGR